VTAGNDSRPFVDRHHERGLLGRVARREEPIRLVSICTGKFGKTSLLVWLEEHCRSECKLPTARVELDKRTDKTPFDLVVRILVELRSTFQFPRFDYWDLARTDEDFVPFRSVVAPVGVTAASVNAAGARLESSLVADHVDRVVLGQGHTINMTAPQPTPWTEKKELVARDRCVQAFLEDLAEISSRQPLMILIDGYDGECPAPVLGWIERNLLREESLLAQTSLLTVVLAGRRPPNIAFRNRPEVHEISTLNLLWKDEEIVEYLRAEGIDATDAAVGIVRTGLHEVGWDFDQLQHALPLLRGARM